ncbi:MAG: hypothetical protein KC496_17045 [Anaerolineae bacterium]|nr:hypothetical protein [Anaerolineae bacterium]
MNNEPPTEPAAPIERLMDAIDLIEAGNKEAARSILRGLIRENSDFEDAWLWMSVAVDSVDQSVVSLENVLRINPKNTYAAEALYRLRQPDILSEQERNRLTFIRDSSRMIFWVLVMTLLFTVLFDSMGFIPAG